MPPIETICDWIILFAAVVAAITTIIKFFKQPFIWGKNKKEQLKEQRKLEIKEVLIEEMPEKFLEHDLETRNKYLSDRQKYLKEIKEEVHKEIKDTLDEIKQLNIEQTKQISLIHQSSKDMLRQRIMMIYHNCRESKKISIYDREALDEAYKDYKAEGGNSYIDKYYSRTIDWETFYPENDD